MTIRDIQEIFETWAPRALAWDRDNVGLQVGSMEREVQKILVALDVTPEVIEEARSNEVELIVTHHPLLFRPPRTVTMDDRVGRMVIDLIQSDIALYSVHTNLDFSEKGVSFILAERLGLQNISVLKRTTNDLRKLVVFVPADYVEKLTAAVGAAGGGVIGKYDLCSFRLEGTGTFRPQEGSQPFAGKPGEFEKVSEVRLEMVVPRWRLNAVLAAMRGSHPYEEIAYDVYSLENETPSWGAGAIGLLPSEIRLKKFLKLVKEELHIPFVRYTGDDARKVHTVAVCGGSGADLTSEAIARGADAFVTADVRYHDFEAAQGRIALIDAGHYETEQLCVAALVQHLQRHQQSIKDQVRVFQSATITNPVHYS